MGIEDLPPFVIRERDALLAEIYEVFRGVNRVGGVSWSEAEVLDAYGSPEDCALARATDKDTCWQELVNDPNWRESPGIGGFSFLDSIGFRYYLAPAMVRALLQGSSHPLEFHLTLPEDKSRDWNLDKWTLLTLAQRQSVKRFLQYMSITQCSNMVFEDGWYEAYESYWRQVPSED